VQTKEDEWVECVSCRNWLHKICSLYKDKCFDCCRELLRKKNSKMKKRLSRAKFSKISFIATSTLEFIWLKYCVLLFLYFNVYIASLL
jgi:hypothetical protein